MHSPVFLLYTLAIIAQISGTMIFPELAPTPFTFICSFGVPVEDLPFETVVTGYALKTHYFLPNNASELTSVYFKPQPITDRGYKNNSNLGSKYRWIIYRGIEMILQNLGLPGHSCLLRAICEHAGLPLTHESGLLGELIRIILTPSSSSDRLDMAKDRAYQSAERFGRRGGNCELAFHTKCSSSAIDLISVLLKEN